MGRHGQHGWLRVRCAVTLVLAGSEATGKCPHILAPTQRCWHGQSWDRRQGSHPLPSLVSHLGPPSCLGTPSPLFVVLGIKSMALCILINAPNPTLSLMSFDLVLWSEPRLRQTALLLSVLFLSEG